MWNLNDDDINIPVGNSVRDERRPRIEIVEKKEVENEIKDTTDNDEWWKLKKKNYLILMKKIRKNADKASKEDKTTEITDEEKLTEELLEENELNGSYWIWKMRNLMLKLKRNC